MGRQPAARETGPKSPTRPIATAHVAAAPPSARWSFLFEPSPPPRSIRAAPTFIRGRPRRVIPRRYVFDVTEATRFCAQVSQNDPRWHASDPLAAAPLEPLGFTVQKVPGGRRAAKFKAPNVVGGTPCHSKRRTTTAPCLLQPGSYALVPSTKTPVAAAAAFVVEMHSDLPLTFQNADDEMPDLEPEEEENPDLDEDSADAAAAASEAGVDAVPLPEPAGSELHALWTQTAFLASLMKDLKTEHADLEKKLKELEEGEP